MICTHDHEVQHVSPLEPLTFVAASTEQIRICPLLLNDSFHHHGLLAQRLGTLNLLSGARLEVGIEAGYAFPKYGAASISFDPPSPRKSRLAESVEILRRLLDGERVQHDDDNDRMNDLETITPIRPHVPIFVGINSRTALAHAAQHEDMIELTMLGKTSADGNSLAVCWGPDHLDSTIADIDKHAGTQSQHLKPNALAQAVVITDNRRKVAEELASLEIEHALATFVFALGTHEQIDNHLLACRERWGISYSLCHSRYRHLRPGH